MTNNEMNNDWILPVDKNVEQVSICDELILAEEEKKQKEFEGMFEARVMMKVAFGKLRNEYIRSWSISQKCGSANVTFWAEQIQKTNDAERLLDQKTVGLY